MPKLKVTASLPQLDRDRYLKDFRDSINKAFIKAARAFLLAAVPRIPIFTGFARGALGNLEDVAGRVSGDRIRGTLGGVTKEKIRPGRPFYYYPPGKTKVLRTNISGRPFATPPDKILMTKAETTSRMIFKFEVDITYFEYLDKEKWGAFAAGKAAFDAELKKQLVALRPQIGKYYIRREIK